MKSRQQTLQVLGMDSAHERVHDSFSTTYDNATLTLLKNSLSENYVHNVTRVNDLSPKSAPSFINVRCFDIARTYF